TQQEPEGTAAGVGRLPCHWHCLNHSRTTDMASFAPFRVALCGVVFRNGGEAMTDYEKLSLQLLAVIAQGISFTLNGSAAEQTHIELINRWREVLERTMNRVDRAIQNK